MPLPVPISIVCICQVLDIWGSGSVFISQFFPCRTVKSASFLLLYFGVYSVHETMPTDSVYSCCLDFSPSFFHCLSFLLFHYPSGSSQSYWSVLFLVVPTWSLFLYGRGILCQCMLGPLLFLQYGLHWHWFLLCMRPHFCVWHTIRP